MAGPVAASSVRDLFDVAHGSPRDFTSEERQDAARALVDKAQHGDDEAARALVDLLGGEFEWLVVESITHKPHRLVVDAMLQRLDTLNLNDTRQAARAPGWCQALAQSQDARAVKSIVRVVDDGATKEMRVACLRALGRTSGPFMKVTTPALDAATKALVRYVDHKALGVAARETLSRMAISVESIRPLLAHKDPEVRAFAVHLVDDLKDPDVKDALERAIVDAKDDVAKARAVRALGRNLVPDAKSPVASQLRLIQVVSPFLADRGEVGSAAVSAVEHVRERALVRPLLGALEHPRSDTREHAAKVLGQIGDKSAKAALWQKLESTPLDQGWSELDAYLRGIVGCGVDVDDAPRLAQFLIRKDIETTSFQSNHKELWVQLGRLPPETAKVFVPLLRSKSRDLRIQVSRLLGTLGNPVAAVALLDIVADKGEGHEDAARALSGCADEAALPRMIAILDARLAKESWNGGGELALSIVRLDRVQGFERTLPLIAKHGLVGVELLRAMLDETHPSDKRAFLHALAQTDRDPSTTYTFQVLGVMGLARIDTAESLATLCTLATTHKEGSVREHAAVGLARFPEQKALACMVRALELDPDGNDEIVRALERATGQAIGKDKKAWRVFVDGGIGLGGAASLVAALDHDDAAVRALAARRLGQERQGLAPLLARLPKESDATARAAILNALVAFDHESAKAPLVAELEKNRASWPEKVALARALDRLGDGRGTLALVKLVDGSDAGDAQRAMLALSEVTGEPPTASPPFWRAWWKAQAERYRMTEVKR